ncbi:MULTISPECIES: DUF5677 domain-containing protein [unclassified Burkholderia]|uniref:DUF5677 domain-containing protein n=1 Tax=unclassified Burkholderia TaxID=2613784 RepID=UPI000A3F77D4|nr:MULTISPECIES: DUF5677 domain-containing protein [unclassified Burkholderia]
MDTIKVVDLLNTSGRILDGMRNLIVRSRPPKGGPDRMRVALVLTIAEQFEAALRLGNAHMSTHAATHVRSMIEALVVMRKLKTNAGYVNQLRYDKLHGEKRVYEGILSDPSIPDEAKLSVKNRLDTCLLEFNSLHAEKYRPKKISQEFGDTGLFHLVGPYAMLCGFSHNDLAVLAFRHQGDSSMVYKQDDDPTLVQSVFSTGLIVLMDAAHQFGKIAKFPDDYFEPIFSSMNKEWHGVLDKTVVS